MQSSSTPTRLAVLISGGGTNLQAILDAIDDGRLDAEVVAVVADRTSAHGLARASVAGVHAVLVERATEEARADYDTRLAASVAEYRPDWIVLAGWMRLLSMNFLGRFPGRVINLHPALPGELPGTRAIERAWMQADRGDRGVSGVMVHLVPDEGVDDGPVLGTTTVPIDTSGTLESFEADVHAAEHRLLVDTLIEICNAPHSPADPPHHPDPPDRPAGAT